MKKLALSFLTLGFVLPLSVLPSKTSFEMANAEGEENKITLSCNDNLAEGSQYYASVSLSNYEEVSALSLQVYFNNDVVTINGTYNTLSSSEVSIYDSSVNDDNIAYSYIFKSIDTNVSHQLFNFYFTVKNGVTAGDYYFDVVVTEAYNSSLDDVEINISRKYFHVTNKTQLKSAYAYLSTSSSINKSIDDEFEFTYYINSYEPSSGEYIIAYDDQLFEFVSLTKLSFFDNMLCDYNASGVGQIHVTFAAINQATNQYLFKIKLRVIANVTTSSQITLTASELYDTEMNPMTFGASALTVNLTFDSSYVEHPKMETSYTLDTVNKEISLDITLEADSHLGAGDFILTFDKTIVTYVSYTKHFSPTSFTVNDKEQQLDQGRVKFSIISTTDIIDATDVITFVFSYNESSQIQHAVFNLSGSGLTDSLTAPIELDISGTEFDITATDFILRWSISYLYMEDESFIGNGTGRCLSEGLYVTAKRELLKLDEYSINNFTNNVNNKYTDELARYLAWASACGDISPFEGDDIIRLNGSTAINKNNVSLVVIIIAFATSILSLSFVCIMKAKRKAL